MAFSGSGSGRFQIRRLVAEMGEPGAGFYRLPRTGAAPTTIPAPDSSPMLTEFFGIVGREPVIGDIAVTIYDSANAGGISSAAWEWNGNVWAKAEAFIDGDLVVAGSIFSNVGISAGISVGALSNILVWDNAADEVPELSTTQEYAGAYLGFANNTTAGSTATQEILLVGDQDNHIFFDGVNLTLSGVVIEDPQIFVTPPTVDSEIENANIPLWVAGTNYGLGDVVTWPMANPQIYQSQISANIGMQPDMVPATVWANITSQVTETIVNVPSVYVSEMGPLTHTDGDLWYDQTIGRLFIFIAADPDTDLTVGTWADVTKN